MTGSDHNSRLPHEAFLVAIASLDNVGPSTLRWLLSHGSPSSVWKRVGEGKLIPGAGARVDSAQIGRWRQQAVSIDPAALWRWCIELNIGVISVGSPAYPSPLADDVDPPVVLFQRGNPAVISAPRVAIVGTRKATGYGIKVARTLGAELTEAGVSVVSGLALGIDAGAHRGALEVITGSTASPNSVGGAGPIAIVGSNLVRPCPRPNLGIADQVGSHGIIYSEVPPGTPSAPWRFPVRNRILAAISDVVVVVESAANGGSMHTVREALDRDKTVLAVPGPIGCQSSSGTNQLLRDGAAPCLETADILVELGPRSPNDASAETNQLFDSEIGAPAIGDRRDERPEPSGDEVKVLEFLGWRPTSLERIAQQCELSPRELAGVITNLEANGWIRVTGSWVERCNS